MARFENRKWVIITLADYTAEQLDDMINVCLQSSVNTLRKNKDGTKTFLKLEGDTPTELNGISPVYNHSEILEILKGSDWTWDE